MACGDAVGAPAEFKARGTFDFISEMPPEGHWTDDTAMAICLANSLIEKKGFDAEDQMDKYARWAHGEYIAPDTRGHIGLQTSAVISQWSRVGGDPIRFASREDRKSGNGSLMRLTPAPMYFYGNLDEAMKNAGLSSMITHGSRTCIESCIIYAEAIHRALTGATKEEILATPSEGEELITPDLQTIIKGEYKNKHSRDIKSSGYVVHSLEASLWSFHKSNSFKEAILIATNLGDDADTTAAITGMLAGAYYGFESIPDDWKRNLNEGQMIVDTADKLLGDKK